MIIADRIFAFNTVVAIILGLAGNETAQQISSLLFAVSAGWFSGGIFGKWIAE